MKVRIYSPFFPYPVTEGAFQVIYDQVRFFAHRGDEVELVIWKNQSEKELDANPLGLNFPVQIHRFSHSHQNVYLRVLHSLWSHFASPELYYYPPDCDERAGLGEVDLAIYHYSFSYPWFKKVRLPAEKKRVVHFHNLEHELSELRSRSFQNKWDPRKWIHQRNARRLNQHERELRLLVDELWFVSPADLEQYGSSHGKALLRLVGPTFDQDLLEFRARSFKRDKKAPPIFGFLGNLEFGPNQDSVRWILEQVAPLLQKRSFTGKILIVGKNPPQVLRDLAVSFAFVEFTGFLEDIEDFWAKISFLLIPHITGSGIRIKLLEALAFKIPVLTNSAAVQRMHPGLSQLPLLFSFDQPSEWADLLLTETAFQTRMLYQKTVFPEVLDGKSIYQFLESMDC